MTASEYEIRKRLVERYMDMYLWFRPDYNHLFFEEEPPIPEMTWFDGSLSYVLVDGMGEFGIPLSYLSLTPEQIEANALSDFAEQEKREEGARKYQQWIDSGCAVL